MNIAAIEHSLYRRIGNHGLQITNGQPNRLQVTGSPTSYYRLSQAIAAIRESHPNAEIDLSPSLEELRKQ